MPGPYDYIPAGKKAMLKDGTWSLVDLDAKVQEDAVQLLGEEKLKTAKLEQVIKELEAEVERLKIQLLEAHPPKGKK
jgi:hypothetical protein